MEYATDRPKQEPRECKNFGDGKCYGQMTMHLIGRCATCPLIYDQTLFCPDFTPKKKDNE